MAVLIPTQWKGANFVNLVMNMSDVDLMIQVLACVDLKELASDPETFEFFNNIVGQFAEYIAEKR